MYWYAGKVTEDGKLKHRWEFYVIERRKINEMHVIVKDYVCENAEDFILYYMTYKKFWL